MLIVVVAAGLVFVYKSFNPAVHTEVFPKCPFRQLTGYQCPGCGSQRATYEILNLNFGKAFSLNPLLLISIPYLLLGVVLERVTLSERMLRVRKILYGSTAIWIVLGIVIIFWIGRNL